MRTANKLHVIMIANIAIIKPITKVVEVESLVVAPADKLSIMLEMLKLTKSCVCRLL